MKTLKVEIHQKSKRVFFYKYKNSNGYQVKREGFKTKEEMLEDINSQLVETLKDYKVKIINKI